jgi:lysozyme family protein
MADFNKIIGFTLKAEGGYSSDPRDSASSFHSTFINTVTKFKGLPVHTNMGVTYRTWVAYAKLKGFTPTGTNFAKMTDAQWYDLAYRMYWIPSMGDVIKSQSIAEWIFEARWGGGVDHMVRGLQTYLNSKGVKPKLVVDGGIGTKTAEAINNYVGTNKTRESEVVTYLRDRRFAYLRSLKDWSNFGNGWTDRVTKLYARTIDNLGDVAVAGGIGLGTFLIAGAIYYIFKKG